MFREAGIDYVAGKVATVVMPRFAMKVHIGEKVAKAA
jgi:hypothetical protein